MKELTLFLFNNVPGTVLEQAEANGSAFYKGTFENQVVEGVIHSPGKEAFGGGVYLAKVTVGNDLEIKDVLFKKGE